MIRNLLIAVPLVLTSSLYAQSNIDTLKSRLINKQWKSVNYKTTLGEKCKSGTIWIFEEQLVEIARCENQKWQYSMSGWKLSRHKGHNQLVVAGKKYIVHHFVRNNKETLQLDEFHKSPTNVTTSITFNAD